MTWDRSSPLLAPEPGWSELTLPSHLGFRPNFVTGQNDSDRLRVRYFLRRSDQHVVGKAWFGPGAQGPPGHAHGGSISALLDEAMGLAGWVGGYSVVAARITINFREMLPLCREVQFESWVQKVEGKKILTRSRLFGADGTLFGDGSGLFVIIDTERFRHIVEQETGQLEGGA